MTLAIKSAVSAKRLTANPIIHSEMLPGDDGNNINGPSLILTPDWLPNRLGKYYLYFAHHGGSYIRLAYADELAGPWTIHRQGTLHLNDTPFCRGHIASPDVHVDDRSRQVRMYFHGPIKTGKAQKSFVALSSDGLDFEASGEVLGEPYLRAVKWKDEWLAMAKGGIVSVSKTGLTGFHPAPCPAFPLRDQNANLPGSVRHVALDVVGDVLHVYFTRIGDAPERILRSQIDLRSPRLSWRASSEELVLAPATPWEGANLPVRASRFGPARKMEHALRDPAIFNEGRSKYLLYATAGEHGIAIAEVSSSTGLAARMPSLQ